MTDDLGEIDRRHDCRVPSRPCRPQALLTARPGRQRRRARSTSFRHGIACSIGEIFIQGRAGFAFGQPAAHRLCPRYDLSERPKHDSVAPSSTMTSPPLPSPCRLRGSAGKLIRPSGITLAFMAFVRFMPTRHRCATTAPRRQENHVMPSCGSGGGQRSTSIASSSPRKAAPLVVTRSVRRRTPTTT